MKQYAVLMAAQTLSRVSSSDRPMPNLCKHILSCSQHKSYLTIHHISQNIYLSVSDAQTIKFYWNIVMAVYLCTLIAELHTYNTDKMAHEA